MKTLFKPGLSALAVAALITSIHAKAGGGTTIKYKVTVLGPGIVNKVSNPEADGTLLLVGSSPSATQGDVATVWSVTTTGTLVNVETYGTMPDSEAVDVNDAGFVIGNWNGAAFVDIPGVGVELIPQALSVSAINNLNSAVVPSACIVGTAPDPSDPTKIVGAIWGVSSLGVTSPDYSNDPVDFIPFDINDDNYMAGSVMSPTGPQAAIAWFVGTQGQIEHIPLVDLHRGDTSVGMALNSAFDVVGYDQGNQGKTTTAFLAPQVAPGRTMTVLGDLGGHYSIAYDLTDTFPLKVVGASLPAKSPVTAGFVWQNGTMTNLNKVLTSALNDSIVDARGINGTGHIAANLRSGHACLLTPQ